MLINSKTKGLTAYQLKWIAIITMSLDHIYKVFYYYWIPTIEKTLSIDAMQSYYLIIIIFGIGSMTMFIFAWFIAEGCYYTHNIKAYIGRLFLFGLLSEIPFQLMINAIVGVPLTLRLGFTNIMFTFMLGAISCYGYQALKDKGCRVLCFIAPILCATISYLLHTDYDIFGVLCVFLCYIIKDKRIKLLSLAGIIILWKAIIYPAIDYIAYGFTSQMILYYGINLCFSLVAIYFLSAYQGERGKKSKYLFYYFYPIHMLVLVFLYWCIS